MFGLKDPQRVVVVGRPGRDCSAAMRLAGGVATWSSWNASSDLAGRAGRIEADGSVSTPGQPYRPCPIHRRRAMRLGEDYRDPLTSSPLIRPIVRSHLDGSTSDVFADPERMAAEIESQIGLAEAAGYRRFVDYVATMYRPGDPRLHRPQPGQPTDPMSPEPAAPDREGRLGPVAAEGQPSFLEGSPHTATVLLPGHVRGSVAAKAWRCTRSSSCTWTRSPASTRPRAACTRFQSDVDVAVSTA